MIKILYIPTGMFISFYIGTTLQTEADQYFINKRCTSLLEIVNYWNSEAENSMFSKRNKLIFPLLIEEFEVINE